MTTYKGLTARVRRALAREGQALRIPRSTHEQWGIHIVDTATNSLVASNCSIDGLAAELGITVEVAA